MVVLGLPLAVKLMNRGVNPMPGGAATVGGTKKGCDRLVLGSALGEIS